MDEQGNERRANEAGERAAAVTAAPAAEAPQKKRRPVRHMIWAVCLIALALMILGQLLGDFLTALPARALGLSDAAWLFLLQYLSCIGIDLAVLLYTLLCERPIFRSVGRRAEPWGRGNTAKMFALGLLVGFGINALCIGAAWLHGDLDFSVGRFDPLYLLAALACVCVQSGAEELLTRGYMLGALRQRYPLWLAVAVNSLFFGALHLFNPGITLLSFLNVTLFGVFASIAMIRFESIWFCIALHTAWNFSQRIFFGLPNSGIVSEGSFLHLEAAVDSALYSTAFGVEGTITTTLVYLIPALLILLLARRRQET